MIPAKPNMGRYNPNDSGYALIRVLEKQVAQLKQRIVVWNETKKRLPDFNKPCLVFIPGEDNHVTSGMYDVSGSWVLLDDYREPKCEITQWAYIEPIINELNKTP